MAKYVYPALLTPDAENGGYYVTFPDLPNCYTDGNDLAEALDNANDALSLTLYSAEVDKLDIPAPSEQHNVVVPNNAIITMVAVDTIQYRRYFDNKAVKKTLTIPNWLNVMAEEQGINFSATLQDALKNALNIT